MTRLDQLKADVCQANLDLVASGLVFHTWGNVSGIDRHTGQVVIKPSGVPYQELTPDRMVVVHLDSGQVLEGSLRPSSDTPTHLVLYRAFPAIGGIVHTHSLYATAWAQACRHLPPLGTTHADFAHGGIPCTRALTNPEMAGDYEANTGLSIVECFHQRDPLHCPAVLVAHHGPFAWGRSAHEAVLHASILEQVARLASETLRLAPTSPPLPPALLDKHFLRKHGPDAYYGQSPDPEPPLSAPGRIGCRPGPDRDR
jgi:L-ribulose-5-phosphate 4-epimerase